MWTKNQPWELQQMMRIQ